IRQFAEERLAESAEGEPVRDRHALFFADQAEAAFERFRSPQEILAYRFVDDEIANARAAFRWAVDHGRADPAIRIAACIHPADRRDRLVLACLISMAGFVGHHLPADEIRESLSQITAAGMPTAIAFALAGQGAIGAQDDTAAGVDLYHEAIDMLASCGDRLLEQ